MTPDFYIYFEMDWILDYIDYYVNLHSFFVIGFLESIFVKGR